MSAALFPDLVVNGETVPHRLIAAEAQNHAAPKGKPGEAWRKAANAIAVRTLLLQEARRRGLDPQPRDLGPGRTETAEEALVRDLLEDEISVSSPSEAEVRDEWARDPSRFRAPPLWEVSHILVAVEPGDEGQRLAAHTRALDLARRAIADPSEFRRLAAENSDCGSRANGGALGQIGPGGTVPEFERALRALSSGEITPEPVLTRHGWHVIRMDACAEGSVLPFESARQGLSAAMEKRAWARAAQAFVAQLASRAEISGADLHMTGDPVPGC